jgi:UDP-N-acetylmuramate--alanine ligase
MTDLLSYQHYYLVGIKGVAMTALAQMLHDAGKQVRGSDTDEIFVTQELLEQHSIVLDSGFDSPLPPETEAVIYTSAHQSDSNPQVKEAISRNIPTISQAEAIADLFNRQKGIAVSGVGGKSTTSAMIAWILEKTGRDASFFVGVGNIPGLNKTGRWNPNAEYFAAEADEYVINPKASETGEEIIPKFSFLHPFITVCTNLMFDHPDVYKDFEHTKDVYNTFFAQTAAEGALIVNEKDIAEIGSSQAQLLTFGESPTSTISLRSFSAKEGSTTTIFSYDNNEYTLVMRVPGKYNAMNALAAILACKIAGVGIEASIDALASFNSTKRRFEFIGEKNGVKYYDDYAHHPNEVESVIKALKEWYPHQRAVIAFQSHTFTRTKRLFDEFVNSFAAADEVVMIDIFSSARESFDPTITSTLLCEAITKKFGVPAKNVGSVENLAEFCKTELKSGDVFITVGAGNIYEVHELLS